MAIAQATTHSVSASSRQASHPSLKWGGVLGVLLAATAVAWVLVANRAPSLERFALQRDIAAALVIGALMFVPFLRFLRSPARIFLSGITSWTILVGAYCALENSFPRLQDRLGAFQLFMLGASVFGMLAATVWVFHIIWRVRQQHPVTTVRRRLP